MVCRLPRAGGPRSFPRAHGSSSALETEGEKDEESACGEKIGGMSCTSARLQHPSQYPKKPFMTHSTRHLAVTPLATRQKSRPSHPCPPNFPTPTMAKDRKNMLVHYSGAAAAATAAAAAASCCLLPSSASAFLPSPVITPHCHSAGGDSASTSQRRVPPAITSSLSSHRVVSPSYPSSSSSSPSFSSSFSPSSSSSSSWSPKSPLYGGGLFSLNYNQGLPRAGAGMGAGAGPRRPARGVLGMSSAGAGASAAAVEIVGDGAGGEAAAGRAGGDAGVKSDLLNQIDLASSSSKRSVTSSYCCLLTFLIDTQRVDRDLPDLRHTAYRFSGLGHIWYVQIMNFLQIITWKLAHMTQIVSGIPIPNVPDQSATCLQNRGTRMTT